MIRPVDATAGVSVTARAIPEAATVVAANKESFFLMFMSAVFGIMKRNHFLITHHEASKFKGK